MTMKAVAGDAIDRPPDSMRLLVVLQRVQLDDLAAAVQGERFQQPNAALDCVVCAKSRVGGDQRRKREVPRLQATARRQAQRRRRLASGGPAYSRMSINSASRSRSR